MIYVKSIGMGLITALLGAIVVLVVEGWLAYRWLKRSGSGGTVSILILNWPVLIAACVGFAFGFWLRFRKRNAIV